MKHPPPLPLSRGVIACLASIPEREMQLERTIESLRPQVSVLCVYLNGYSHTPHCLRQICGMSATSEQSGDRGDAGKFFWAWSPSGYHFTCDDDLEYPPDYVETMCAAIDRYDRKAAVGLHGVVLSCPLGRTYEASRATVFHFGEELDRDMPVNLLGTGCLAYHRDTLEVVLSDFPEANMADIWFALACERRAVPRVCIAHEAGWVKQLPFTSSIWDRRKADVRLVEALRQGEPWIVLTPEGGRS